MDYIVVVVKVLVLIVLSLSEVRLIYTNKSSCHTDRYKPSLNTLQRWVYKFTPLIEGKFRKRKKPVGNSWKMDETCIKVKGEWMYLYRAVKPFNKMVVLKSLTLIKAVRIKKRLKLITKGALRESKCVNVNI